MKKYLILIATIPVIFTAFSQEFERDKEEDKIEKVVAGLVDAWTQADAKSFASYFSEDADFMVWFGLHMQGRNDIAFGHNMIFNDFYSNTTWNLKIKKIRFIGDNVALVHAAGAVVKNGDPTPEEPDAVPLIVLNRVENNWEIIALQNTPFAVNEFRVNGDINRMKRIAGENRGK